MKIEKINENQIRCTLTKEDLASRQLKLSELAYGTEKAKRLFREMMQQANFEFGFEAEDIPLMIEAIPMNAECVVLLITKVADPEELDTRFSHFSPSDSDMEGDDDEYDDDSRYNADEIVQDMLQSIPPINTPESNRTAAGSPTRTFRFRALSDVMNAAAQVGSVCPCPNALYKDENGNGYLLVISRENSSPEDFSRICNILSEYGFMKFGPDAGHIFLEEHCEALLPANALQSLCGN